MADGDGLIGGLGTLIVAGAVLGAMNRNNRGNTRTRTVTKTRYVTAVKPVKKLKPKKKSRVVTVTRTRTSKTPNWLA